MHVMLVIFYDMWRYTRTCSWLTPYTFNAAGVKFRCTLCCILHPMVHIYIFQIKRHHSTPYLRSTQTPRGCGFAFGFSGGGFLSSPPLPSCCPNQSALRLTAQRSADGPHIGKFRGSVNHSFQTCFSTQVAV